MQATDPDRSPAPQTRSRRRRWRWVFLAGLLVCAGAGFLAPTLVAPLVKSRLIAALQERLHARASIETLVLSWSGDARLEGLLLRSVRGTTLAHVDFADLHIDPWSALGGDFELSLTVRGYEVTAQQDATGRWNFEDLLVTDDAQPGDASADSGSTGGRAQADAAPRVRARVELLDGRLVVVGHEREALLALDRVTCAVDGLDRPVTLQVEGRIESDGLQSGPVSLEGAWTIAPTAGPGSGRLKLAAELGGDARLRLDAEFSGGPRAVTGEASLRGSLATLLAALGDLLPLQDGVRLDGDFDGELSFQWSDAGAGDTGSGGAGSGGAGGTLTLRELAGTDAAGAALDFAALGTPGLTFDGRFDSRAFELVALAAELGPVTLTGRARIERAGERFAIQDSSLELEADLDRLLGAVESFLDLEPEDLAGHLSLVLSAREEGQRTRLEGRLSGRGVALGAFTLDGAPLELAATLEPGTPGMLRGTLGTERLQLSDGEGRGVDLHQARLTFAVELDDPAADPRLEYSSPAATIAARRSARGVDRWHLEVGGSLALLRRDLAGLPSLEELQPEGELTGHLDIDLTTGVVGLQGGFEVTELEFSLPAGEEGEPPPRVHEPRVTIQFDAEFDPAGRSLDLERVTLESETLGGTMHGRLWSPVPVDSTGALDVTDVTDVADVTDTTDVADTTDIADAGDAGVQTSQPTILVLEGLVGEFTYVPDRLAPLLSPWLPGELSGSERETFSVHLDGRLDELALEQVLASCQGGADLTLGLYRLPGLELDGTLTVGLEGGRTTFAGELGANGGALSFRGQMGDPGQDEPGASLQLTLDAVRAGTALAPLLSLAHPAFAALEQLEGSQLDGLIHCELDLSYAGALSLADLQQGWDTLPLENISGTGVLQLEQAVLRGSPLLSQLLGDFYQDGERALKIAPVHFRIQDARLIYESPWTWTIRDSQTAFTGSLGFDRSLALDWSVPVTAELVRRYGFLKSLQGQNLEVPIRGTARHPRIDLQGVLAGAAQTALRARVSEELNLERILQDAVGQKAGDKKAGEKKQGAGGEVDQNDPQALLAEADRLWEAGEKPAAAVLYNRIRDEFKYSTVYLLNRNKIKRRRK